jgi:TonB family protein
MIEGGEAIMPKVAGILALVAAAIGTSSFDPAHLQGSGALPGAPAFDVGGGEVRLELSVSADGAVENVVTLRETPPYTEALRERVLHWSFAPAQEAGAPVASHVLVVGQFRPPTLVGPAIGELPKDVAAASAEVAVPTQSPMPPYPVEALGDATVLVEATVGSDGQVSDAKVLAGSAPFSTAALDAVRGWRFTPASRAGAPVPGTVCVVVGFRSPVVGPAPVTPVPPPSTTTP